MRVHAGMNKPLRGVGCLAVAFLAFAAATPAAAHPHVCPADLPDAPVLAGHIEHADILAGKHGGGAARGGRLVDS